MPRVELDFDDETFSYEINESRLLGVWEEPTGWDAEPFRRELKSALESPLDFPPLRQAVVPGDRVVIALDVETPQAGIVLREVAAVLNESGVENEDVKVVTAAPVPDSILNLAPQDWTWIRHHPEDRKELAYLASTAEGRRVYLNRELVDADFALPIGRIGHDPIVGRRGPWSLLFPALSDEETLKSLRPVSGASPGESSSSSSAIEQLMRESAEIGWLLGSQFQIGVVPGRRGPSRVVAGMADSVAQESRRTIDESWTYRAHDRAGLVIAGIRRSEGPTRIADIADGLATASGVVQRGGRIALLSRANDEIGPSLARLLDRQGAGDSITRKLKGLEREDDYWAARRIALAADWADVYLLSDFEPDAFEELAIISLSGPEQVNRLIDSCGSCIVLNHANAVHAAIAD